MALSDSQTGRRPFWRRSGPRPPANPEPPSLTQTTFPACRAQYPGGPDQVLVGWRVARSRAGFFPVRAAFPVSQAGRRPHLHFRGLLELHTRYGLQSCSPTIRGLYREASPWPVSQLGRSQATKFNQQPPWVGPSPTGDLRLWGALRNTGYLRPVRPSEKVSAKRHRGQGVRHLRRLLESVG